MRSLEGVRVLDLSRLLPGPFCSQLLVDLGAEVIKVEEQGLGDYTRWMPPHVGDTSAVFAALNRGKKSIVLNLKSPEGRQLLLKLAADADVLLESFRPGVATRLGIDYATLHKQSPRLIYCAITGYGQTGPYSGWAGHDVNYLAYAGALGLTGDAEGAPAIPAIQIADLAGGAYPAAVGILSALLGREKTGEGRFLDISMTEGALALMSPLYAMLGAGGSLPGRSRLPLTGGHPCYRVYPTRDGQWLAVGSLEPKFFDKLCHALGRPDLADQGLVEGVHADRVAAELEAIFRQRDRDEWMALLEAADACIAPVLRPEEALENAQHRERGAFLHLSIPGEKQTPQVPASPVRDGTQVPNLPAPGMGQHTDEVLGRLGIQAAELARLREQGIIG